MKQTMMKTITILTLLAFISALGAAAETVNLNQAGGDANTYKGTHDYTTSSVAFQYQEQDDSRLKGTITATGLKPGFTYQVKIMGKPTCLFAGGNDQANEYLGYKGRWTCTDCAGTAVQRNRNDADYVAKSHFKGDASECIQGYLVFGFFTTDASGAATKYVESDSSYHVLWCSGGTCGSAVNTELVDGLCAAADVNGQIERGSCGTMTLADGEYDVIIAITEESFHQGDWATVLKNDNLPFTIGSTTPTTLPPIVDLDYMNLGDIASEAGHDVDGWSGTWTWGGGYGGGDDGTLRTIIPRTESCVSDDKTAYFTMQADGSAQTLQLRHLMGSQNDGYDLYIKDGGNWVKLTLASSGDQSCSGGECWYTDAYDLGGRTGNLEFKVVALLTSIPDWCTSWGLNAFSWARISGTEGGQISVPEFATMGAALVILLTAPGFAYVLAKRRR